MKLVSYTFICDGCDESKSHGRETPPNEWDWAKISIRYEDQVAQQFLCCRKCKDTLVNNKSPKAGWLSLVARLLKRATP